MCSFGYLGWALHTYFVFSDVTHSILLLGTLFCMCYCCVLFFVICIACIVFCDLYCLYCVLWLVLLVLCFVTCIACIMRCDLYCLYYALWLVLLVLCFVTCIACIMFCDLYCLYCFVTCIACIVFCDLYCLYCVLLLCFDLFHIQRLGCLIWISECEINEWMNLSHGLPQSCNANAETVTIKP
jgi:hypothetical protein